MTVIVGSGVGRMQFQRGFTFGIPGLVQHDCTHLTFLHAKSQRDCALCSMTTGIGLTTKLNCWLKIVSY